MMAMQYSFVLPADYDMAIIDRRIRDKGPMLDGFPHLRFKAYLSARKQDDGFASTDNLYAPFYLWDAAEGIDAFLTGPGFAALTRDYGRPIVRNWVVWHAEWAGDLADARFADRAIEAIAEEADLAALRADAVERARAAVREGALAAIVGFDPAEWRFIVFRLLRERPAGRGRDRQIYRVGYVAKGSSR